MAKDTIRLYFTDFWPLFNIKDNYFLDLLKKRFKIILDPIDPEFLIYSNFGIEYKKFNCIKIYYTGENTRPDFNECDFAFTFDHNNDPRHYRLPLYPIFGNVCKLTEPKPDFDAIKKEKTGFCNFIYSNPANPVRNEFFKKLNKYKKVDSGGRLYRNINKRIGNKLDFIRKYKFTIAFENESYPGYTTEKIFEPMLVNSLPIYWGNPLVHKDFNPKSFINCHEFNSLDEVVDKIAELDNDWDKYLEYYEQPYFHNNSINQYVEPENILNRFEEIFNSSKKPISENTLAASESKFIKNLWMLKNRTVYNTGSVLNKVRNFSLEKAKIKTKKMFE